jgi:hypothetical protein
VGKRFAASEGATVRFEMPPGEQIQIDLSAKRVRIGAQFGHSPCVRVASRAFALWPKPNEKSRSVNIQPLPLPEKNPRFSPKFKTGEAKSRCPY